MSPTWLSTSTQGNTLHLELVTAEDRNSEVQPADMVALVESIRLICRIGYAIGAPRDTPDLKGIEREEWLEPRLLRLHYGSPFEAITELAGPILTSAAAMSVVIYALKRLWTLPTEIRTHSQAVEAEYLQAETAAIHALRRRDEAHRKYMDSVSRPYEKYKEERASPDPDAQMNRLDRLRREIKPFEAERESAFESIDREARWPKGTTDRIERAGYPGWKGESALWFAEDDEPFS